MIKQTFHLEEQLFFLWMEQQDQDHQDLCLLIPEFVFSVPLPPPPHLFAVVCLAVVDRSFYSVRPGAADHLVCVGKEVLPLLLTVFSCATEPADL